MFCNKLTHIDNNTDGQILRIVSGYTSIFRLFTFLFFNKVSINIERERNAVNNTKHTKHVKNKALQHKTVKFKCFILFSTNLNSF